MSLLPSSAERRGNQALVLPAGRHRRRLVVVGGAGDRGPVDLHAGDTVFAMSPWAHDRGRSNLRPCRGGCDYQRDAQEERSKGEPDGHPARQILAKNEGFEFVLSERIGPCRQPIGIRRPASRVGAGRRLAKRAVDD